MKNACTRKEPYDIPCILESIANDVDEGKLSIHDAAVELCKAGWSTYVNEEKTERLISQWRKK